MSSNGTNSSSLRRCDLYDNPYNARLQANPDIVRQRQAQFEKSKDTISSAQVKLEKDVFKLFKKRNFQLLPGKLLIIGKVGKFVFIIVMLPAYLFCYGIPKWLITQAAPHTFKFIEKIFTNLKSKSGSVVSFVVSSAHAMVKKVTDPILNFIQTRVDKVRQFYHRVTQTIERYMTKFSNLVLYPFRAVKTNVIAPVVNIYKKINRAVVNFKERLTHFHHKIRETLILFPKRLDKFLQNKAVQFQQKFTEIEQFISRPFKIILLPVQKVIDKFVKVVQKIIEKPKALLQKAFIQIKTSIERVVEPLVRWVSLTAKRTVELKDKIVAPVKDKILDTSQKIARSFEKIVDKSKRMVTNVSQTLVQIIPVPVISFMTSFIPFISRNFPKKLFKSSGKMRKKIKRIKERVYLKFAAANQRFLRWMRRFFEWLKPKALASPMQIYRVLKKISCLIKEVLKGAFLLLRLLLAWLKVLIRHGMKTVYQIASSSFPELR